jgi:hypothetical protein
MLTCGCKEQIFMRDPPNVQQLPVVANEALPHLCALVLHSTPACLLRISDGMQLRQAVNPDWGAPMELPKDMLMTVMTCNWQ